MCGLQAQKWIPDGSFIASEWPEASPTTPQQSDSAEPPTALPETASDGATRDTTANAEATDEAAIDGARATASNPADALAADVATGDAAAASHHAANDGGDDVDSSGAEAVDQNNTADEAPAANSGDTEGSTLQHWLLACDSRLHAQRN